MPGFEIFGDEEKKEVMDVLDTGVLMRYGFDAQRKGVWKTKSLEKEIAERLKVKYCHVCSSGTAALSIALAACGVGAGDEVIVPPFTFVATIEAVILAGAVPVFSEIDKTLCLNPDRLEAVITPRTKAVMPVHMCGSMAKIDKIKEVADKKGIVLIEDACQSFGGTFEGKALGTFGKIGCFSFDPVKTITCGEGGAIITNHEKVYETAQFFADHGHTHLGSDRGLEDHPILGTNYRISELNSAVGLAQVRKIDSIIKKQRAAKEKICKALCKFDLISLREIPDEKGDTATFLSFLGPDEKSTRELASQLGKAKVDGCAYWYDNRWHYIRSWDHFKNMSVPSPVALQLLENISGRSKPDYNKVELPESDNIMGKTISMQIKLSWTDDDIEKRIENIAKTVEKVFG